MPDVIPIDALFDEGNGPNLSEDFRPLLKEADVIFGVDVMSKREFLVFGRKRLQKIAKTGVGEELAVLYIGVDQETDELEKLCALMLVVKGRCDYQ